MTETEILTIHPRNNFKPRTTNVVSNERQKPNRVTDKPTNKGITLFDSTDLKKYNF